MTLPGRITLAAVLGSSLVIATGALAANPGPGPVGPPKLCAPPSLDECQREFAGKGRQQCIDANTEACKPILGQAFADQAAADRGTTCQQTNAGPVCTPGASVDVILPPAMTNNGKLLSAAPEYFDNNALTTGGSVSSDLTYSSVRQIELLPGGYSRFDTLPGHPNLASQHADFDANGAEVQSCREYVFEKYYDYERFEEAAASCRNDFLCLGELVALHGDENPGLDKPTLLSRDRARSPMGPQVRPQASDGPFVPLVTKKKNTFFEEPPGIFVARMRARKGAKAIDTAIIEAMVPAFSAGSLADYTYTDRLAWHMQLRDEQAPLGMTLAEYRAIELRSDRYLAALDDYRAVRKGIPPGDLNRLLDPATFNSCGHPFKFAPDTHAIIPDPKCAHPYQSWVPPNTSETVQFYKRVDAIIDLLVEEWAHPSVLDGVTVDHGCLDPSGVRCDWSPKLLLEYLHLFQKVRENDFRECLRSTGNLFGPHASVPFMEGNLLEGRLDARTDWPTLEGWYVYAAGIRKELLKGLPFDGSDLGSSKEGGDGRGDPDIMRGEYEYRAGYRVHLNRNGDGATCSMSGHFTGKAKAVVSVLGKPAYTVLDAEATTTAGEDGTPAAHTTTHLVVANKTIFSEPDHALEFHYAGDKIESQNIFDYHQTIVIGFVPVTFGTGAEIDLGFSADVAMTAPQPAVCDPVNPATVELTGTFTPSVAARGYVYGAIGGELAGFGAEAGIEGDIDLVKISLPLTATLKAKPNFDFDIDGALVGRGLGINFKSTANIDITLLSGDVKAYAEVCFLGCDRIERTIFSWPGIHLVNTPAWKPIDKTFPVTALASAPPPPPVTP